jgi:hypothetical protein
VHQTNLSISMSFKTYCKTNKYVLADQYKWIDDQYRHLCILSYLNSILGFRKVTLSAKLWLSVAWPLLALTWTTSFGFPSSLLFTPFPLLELCNQKHRISSSGSITQQMNKNQTSKQTNSSKKGRIWQLI